MQDSTLKALHPNNAVVNPLSNNQEMGQSSNFPLPHSLPSTPSVALLEESLQTRLEAFAFDAQANLEHSLQTDMATIKEHLEVQWLQLRYLINEIAWLEWLREMNH